jgi:hypothetical protein
MSGLHRSEICLNCKNTGKNNAGKEATGKTREPEPGVAQKKFTRWILQEQIQIPLMHLFTQPSLPSLQGPGFESLVET